VHRFYAPDLGLDREVQLPADEARHLSQVLRLKPGAEVAIFDGRGVEALARVEIAEPRKTIVRVTSPRSPAPEAAIAVTLAQAVLKSDKMDRVIRDAVMLGVAAIQPFVSRTTEVPRDAIRRGGRHERWNRTVLASVKQCGRAVVPAVFETIELAPLLDRTAGRTGLMFIEPSRDDVAPVDLRALEASRPDEVTIFIGPEGGWAPEEVEQARNAGVVLVTLGRRTLRADAAGAAALAVLRYAWRDL
jgi:16S rRNA (uracil1498-N3)-methyltransferase